jgi:peptide/nickel transport system permease protein
MQSRTLTQGRTVDESIETPIRQSRRAGLAKRLMASSSATVGGIIFLLVLVLMAFGPLASPYDPIAMSPAQRLLPPGAAGHVLGTDQVGRDMLTRVMVGARLTLLMGAIPVGLSLLVGTVLGLLAGYYAGWSDHLIMRILDVVFAFPAVLLAIAIVAAIGPGLANAILAMTVVEIPTVARIVRAPVLSLREQDFVLAARVLGARDGRILLRHIGRSVVSPVIVFASLETGTMIIFGSGLSFLGLGPQPPQPEWGLMLAEGRSMLAVAPHVATIPGLAIVIVVLGLNFLGDGLRDALDPKSGA